MKNVAFFNNKGGVGKTSLVYHIAWMLSLNGISVLVADLDPQANATSIFLEEELIDKIWHSSEPATASKAVRSLRKNVGDVAQPHPLKIADNLHLLAGDLDLAEFEDQLSETWPKCLDRDERAFRVTTALSRVVASAGQRAKANVALIDVGPNLGAINRAALIASDHVILPISPDLFAIRGLENVGPKLRAWRENWSDRKSRAPDDLDFVLPSGEMRPIGYVISRYSVFARGPVKTYKKWLDRAPDVYANSVLNNKSSSDIDNDANLLATLKDYRSLMPLAQEARKPMFSLRPSDGAIGGHQAAVRECYDDFYQLSKEIMSRIDNIYSLFD